MNSRIASPASTLLLANRMKLPSATPSLRFLMMALASYLLFLIVAVIGRVGKGRQPLGRLHRLHFRTAGVYLIASIGDAAFNCGSFSLSTASDWLIGLVVYFGIHYAIVANFFAIAQASVSTSVVSILDARGGRATRAVCMEDYAGGEGFGYIKKTRLARIQSLLGWVSTQDGRYRLTAAGGRMVRLTRGLLRLWGVTQIGKAPGS